MDPKLKNGYKDWLEYIENSISTVAQEDLYDLCTVQEVDKHVSKCDLCKQTKTITRKVYVNGTYELFCGKNCATRLNGVYNFYMKMKEFIQIAKLDFEKMSSKEFNDMLNLTLGNINEYLEDAFSIVFDEL